MPRVALSKLSAKSYGSRDYIKGRITSLKDYSARSQRAQLSLRSEPFDPEHDDDHDDDDDDNDDYNDDDEMEQRTVPACSAATWAEVHLVGPWVAQLQGRFDIGLKVRFSLHNASVGHVEGCPSCKLVYSNGVSFEVHERSGDRVKRDILGSSLIATDSPESSRNPVHDECPPVAHRLKRHAQAPDRCDASGSEQQSSSHEHPTPRQQSKGNTPLLAVVPHKRSRDVDTVSLSSKGQGSKSKKNRTNACNAVAPAPAVAPLPPTRKVRTAWGLVTTGVEYGKERRFEYLAFSELEQSKNQPHLDVMAIVLETSSIGKGNGKDYSITLDLSTPDYAHPLTVTYFAPSAVNVVNPEIGDVVILQHLNWSKDRQRFIAYPNSRPRFAVLERADLLRESNSAEPPTKIGAQSEESIAVYGKAEIEYARDLVRADCSAASVKQNKVSAQLAQTSTALNPNISKKPRASGRKMTKIKDMRPDVFCDTVVQIMRIYADGHQNLNHLDKNQAISVFVTDFTENDQLFDYDTFEDGPSGRYMLQVSIFGCQAEPLDQLMRPAIGKKPGQGRAVHLVNLRPKINPNGYLEGTIMPDPKYEQKRDVILLGASSSSDPLLIELHKRRLAYQAALVPAEPILAPVFNATIVTPSFEHSPAQVGAVGPGQSQLVASGPDPELTYSLSRMISSDLVGDFRVRARVVHFFPEAVRWVLAYCAEPSCCRKLPANKDTCIEHPGGGFNLRYFFHFELVDESLQGKTIAVKFDSESDWAGFLPNLPPAMNMRRDASAQNLALRQRFDSVFGGVTSLHHRAIANVPEQNWGPAKKWIIHKTARGEYLVGEGMHFS